MKYVVAGNIAEYKHHIYKKGYDPQEYIYVSSPMVLRGRSEVEGFYIGSYEQREDIQEIREIIAYIKAKSVLHVAHANQPLPPLPTPVVGSPLSIGYGLAPTSIMIRTKTQSGNTEWQTFPA